MSRHIYKFLLIGLLFLLAVIPAGNAKAANEVVVRIPVEESAKLNRSAIRAERMIDYGSFLWAVMDSQDLAVLDNSGAQYQTIENPYTLTLGGQSFDPLFSTPSFSAALSGKEKSGGAGLHLIQFHGPIKDEWLTDLEAAGLEILQYIHPFTYVVWGETTAMDQSRGQEAVRWAGDYLPAYAVLPENRALNSDPILVRAVIIPQAGLKATIAKIENLGGKLVSSSSGSDPVFDLATFLMPGNLLGTAATLTGVYTISPVPMDGGDRGEMSNQINVGNYDGSNLAFTGYQDWLDSVGLSGDGVIIANVDSGVDQTHPDLVNRVIACTGTTCGNFTTSDHGTHTAGIMAADGSSGEPDTFGFLRGLGMAPGTNLIEQVYDPTFSYVGGMLTLMTESYNNGAVVSGNSWGPAGTPQGYDEDTRLVDVGVRDAVPGTEGNQQLSYILSIMNGYGGPSKQGSPDEAKNTFTVGATQMQNDDGVGSQKLNINDLANVTAHGPALDGRTIPHLVAPGCYVDSTVFGGTYDLMCGTSMSSPHVTGSVALFIEYYRKLSGRDPSPAMVKAAFLPVAHDLAGNLDADGGTLGHPFDSKQGWGRLSTATVLNETLSAIYIDQDFILDNTGETISMTFTAPETIPYLHAMLVWTDAPGHGLGGSTPAWVNNLDFSLTINETTYLGNNFGLDGISAAGGSADGMNNTEGIFLENSPAGSYNFTISATEIAGDGVPNFGDGTDQDFALVIYTSPDAFTFQYYQFPMFFH